MVSRAGAGRAKRFTCPLQNPNTNLGNSCLATTRTTNKYFIILEGALSSHKAPVRNRYNRSSSALCTIYSSCKSGRIFPALLSFLPETQPVRLRLHALAGTTLPLSLLLQRLQSLRLTLTHKPQQIHNVSQEMPKLFNNTEHHYNNQTHCNAANSG